MISMTKVHCDIQYIINSWPLSVTYTHARIRTSNSCSWKGTLITRFVTCRTVRLTIVWWSQTHERPLYVELWLTWWRSVHRVSYPQHGEATSYVQVWVLHHLVCGSMSDGKSMITIETYTCMLKTFKSTNVQTHKNMYHWYLSYYKDSYKVNGLPNYTSVLLISTLMCQSVFYLFQPLPCSTAQPPKILNIQKVWTSAVQPARYTIHIFSTLYN